MVWTGGFHSLIGAPVNTDPKSDLDRELLLFEQKLPKFFSGVVDWVRRPTSRLISLGMWLGLAVATFVILVLGYGLGIWSFPA